ncbi:MAG: 3D domain-containing protein [Bacillota bacterium]|nr:3D domain-containing protein [Bacillota bacterium]MDW7678060.1 3D domain-containing protein [Bacillota bacterium]
MKRLAGIMFLLLLVILLWEARQHLALREAALIHQRREVADLHQRVIELEIEKNHLQEALRLRLRETQNLTEQVEQLRTIPAVVTAYAPLDPHAAEGMCYEGDPRITATGTVARPGVVAADFGRLPAGTRLDIPGYGIGVVEDIGSALRQAEGIRLDVLMEYREEALKWGRQTLDVQIALDRERGGEP